MSESVSTINCLSKHIDDSCQVWLLASGILELSETISSIVSLTPDDPNITAASGSVIASTITKTFQTQAEDGTKTDHEVELEAGKAIVFTVSGGTSGSGTKYITAKLLTSAGNTLCVDCKVDVKGIDV
jgi:hypothetical protein